MGAYWAEILREIISQRAVSHLLRKLAVLRPDYCELQPCLPSNMPWELWAIPEEQRRQRALLPYMSRAELWLKAFCWGTEKVPDHDHDLDLGPNSRIHCSKCLLHNDEGSWLSAWLRRHEKAPDWFQAWSHQQKAALSYAGVEKSGRFPWQVDW